jgi:hypothetical protein
MTPVDKLEYCSCATQPLVRLLNCQAGMSKSKAERQREAERNGKTARYLTRAFQKRKPMKQESEGCCRTTNAMCGQRPHRQSQRRAGHRKQSGKLATLRGRQGAGRRKAERMALVAKDFQSQAQWALVAIPAPIYVLGGDGAFCGRQRKPVFATTLEIFRCGLSRQRNDRHCPLGASLANKPRLTAGIGDSRRSATAPERCLNLEPERP